VALVQTKGVLVLSGANTFSGGTTVYGGGTLQIGATDTLPVTSPLMLGGTNGAGNLVLGSFGQTVAALSVASIDSAANNLVTIGTDQTLAINGPNGLLVGVDKAPTAQRKPLSRVEEACPSPTRRRWLRSPNPEERCRRQHQFTGFLWPFQRDAGK
jgi:autotransporter-associated beta strand protein